MLAHRPVLVMEMPEQLSSVETRTLMQDIQPLLDSPEPRLVFDCSQVHHIDGAAVTMFLSCLELAMKRDGDLRLAALPKEVKAFEELRQAFAAFTTCEEAVRSFNAPAQWNRKSAPSSVKFGPNAGALEKAS
jgi:anti-sigma B factor antagonist